MVGTLGCNTMLRTVNGLKISPFPISSSLLSLAEEVWRNGDIAHVFFTREIDTGEYAKINVLCKCLLSGFGGLGVVRCL